MKIEELQSGASRESPKGEKIKEIGFFQNAIVHTKYEWQISTPYSMMRQTKEKNRKNRQVLEKKIASVLVDKS